MIISRELCSGCAKCVIECPVKAISATEDGRRYSDGQRYAEINQELCNNCADIADVECARVCTKKAITRDDGTIPEIDATPRLMTAHLSYVIAVMGDRDGGEFPAGHPKWDPFRKMIANAFLDPEMKIRLTRQFDDMCIGCATKQTRGHIGSNERTSDEFFEQLGIKPGTVINFWDAVKLAEKKYTLPFLKKVHYQGLIDCYCRFVSSDSAAFTDNGD